MDILLTWILLVRKRYFLYVTTKNTSKIISYPWGKCDNKEMVVNRRCQAMCDWKVTLGYQSHALCLLHSLLGALIKLH